MAFFEKYMKKNSLAQILEHLTKIYGSSFGKSGSMTGVRYRSGPPGENSEGGETG